MYEFTINLSMQQEYLHTCSVEIIFHNYIIILNMERTLFDQGD